MPLQALFEKVAKFGLTWLCLEWLRLVGERLMAG